MATHLRAVDPKAYYQYFLDQNIRPDGRELDKFRPSSISLDCIKTANGSALVKFGNTTVVCGIKAELTTPPATSPNEGFYVPNMELPPLCSSRFRPGPPGEQAQIYTQLLLDILENSGCIDKKNLCIQPGKLVWCLFIDIICLSYDGCILDAAVLSIIGALKTTKLAKVIIEDADKIQVSEKTELISVQESPVSTSFSVLFDGKVIVDPTDEEEKLSEGDLTIVLKENGDICKIHKSGGRNVSEEELKLCISKSEARSREVMQLLRQSLNLLK